MESIGRTSQVDMVVNELKDFLLSDEIQEGDKLPNEKTLYTTLHVGRSTVREAIRVLSVMGYVKILPGKGAFLAHKHLDQVDSSLSNWFLLNRPSIVDIVDVRISMETLAIKLAIEKSSDEELLAIDAKRRIFEEAVEQEEYGKLGQYDTDFHASICTAAKNSVLTALYRVVEIAFSDFREHSFRIKEHAANAVMPHLNICNAIMARDVDLAQLHMVRHLRKIIEDVDLVIGE